MKFCPECGTKLMSGGTFCSECGFRVSSLTGSGTLPPKDTAVLTGRAREAAGAGNYKLALGSLEELASADPGNPKVWNNKGLIHSKMGQYPLAVESFDKALELDDTDAHIWYGKGAALLNLGKTGDAEECMEKTLSLDPGYSLATEGLAKCKGEAGGTPAGDAAARGSEPCPICNSGMRFWDDNWWCDMCNVYPFLDDASPYTSSTDSLCDLCGGSLRRIEKYDRYWCNTCMKYAPRRGQAETTGFAPPSGVVSCHRCGTQARYIQQYGRNWCDACRNYT